MGPGWLFGWGDGSAKSYVLPRSHSCRACLTLRAVPAFVALIIFAWFVHTFCVAILLHNHYRLFPLNVDIVVFPLSVLIDDDVVVLAVVMVSVGIGGGGDFLLWLRRLW